MFRGLKALGVRDLSYRLAFLACHVESTNPRVCYLISYLCTVVISKYEPVETIYM